MSTALYEFGGLRFWTEDEIELREAIQRSLVGKITRTLQKLNPIFRVLRVEGPLLIPQAHINETYTCNDVFVTNHVGGNQNFCLRPETTHSTYQQAKHDNLKLPVCYWQVGKSFRREKNDGASASKLRYNEFWQLEFQCIYRQDTKADYRQAMIECVIPDVMMFTQTTVRQIPSDRLPSYSKSTIDLECLRPNNKWREIASCSLRTDYADDIIVAEMAFGLDRLVEIAMEKQ